MSGRSATYSQPTLWDFTPVAKQKVVMRRTPYMLANGHPLCLTCKAELTGSHPGRKYCGQKCKSHFDRHRYKLPVVTHHVCLVCETEFEIGPGQANKWLCSDLCRKKKNTDTVREFHKKNPERQAIYQSRTRVKCPPDSSLRRFYTWNPNAPRSCQSCGENRVLEVAHKPGHERCGRRRQKANCQWPSMVWVLCPTCHSLLDRMGYSPEELGLKEQE